MTTPEPDFAPRLFSDVAAIRRIGEGLLARSLPRPEWTHEAHLAACSWIVCERPDIQPERDLPAVIADYNVSVGGVNDDTQGYHETLTQFYVAAVRAHLSAPSGRGSLLEAVNALLVSPRGRRDYPLRFYSRERLFSVEARRRFVAPDLAALLDV
jgi:hypothetical protein